MHEMDKIVIWSCILILLTEQCCGLPKPVVEHRTYGSPRGIPKLTETKIGQHENQIGMRSQPMRDSNGEPIPVNSLSHETVDWAPQTHTPEQLEVIPDVLPFGLETGEDLNNFKSAGFMEQGSNSVLPGGIREGPSSIAELLRRHLPQEFLDPSLFADSTESHAGLQQGNIASTLTEDTSGPTAQGYAPPQVSDPSAQNYAPPPVSDPSAQDYVPPVVSDPSAQNYAPPPVSDPSAQNYAPLAVSDPSAQNYAPLPVSDPSAQDYVPPAIPDPSYSQDYDAPPVSEPFPPKDYVPPPVSDPSPAKVYGPSSSSDPFPGGRVPDVIVRDILGQTFNEGEHHMNHFLGDLGAAVVGPKGKSHTELSPEPAIHTEVQSRAGDHSQSQSSSPSEVSQNADHAPHSHEHDLLDQGLVRDPDTGRVTHIVDPHDGSILPIQHHDELGLHAIDPHVEGMLLTLGSESNLPNHDHGQTEAHTMHGQNTPNKNEVSNLVPETSLVNNMGSEDTGRAVHDAVPMSNNFPWETHGHDSHPTVNTRSDFTGNQGTYIEPVLEPKTVNLHAHNTGQVVKDKSVSDYSGNNNMAVDTKSAYGAPQSTYDQPMGGNVAGGGYTNDVGGINEPAQEPVPLHGDYTGNAVSEVEPVSNHLPIEIHAHESQYEPVDMAGIDYTNNAVTNSKPVLEPLPIGTYAEDPATVGVLGSDYTGNKVVGIGPAVETVPGTSYGQDTGLEQLPINAVTGASGGDYVQPALGPISQKSYGQNSVLDQSVSRSDTPDTGLLPLETIGSDYTGKKANSFKPIVDPFPQTSYGQGPGVPVLGSSHDEYVGDSLVNEVPVPEHVASSGSGYVGDTVPIEVPVPEHVDSSGSGYIGDNVPNEIPVPEYVASSGSGYVGDTVPNEVPVPEHVPQTSYGAKGIDPSLVVADTASSDYTGQESHPSLVDVSALGYTGDTSSDIKSKLDSKKKGYTEQEYGSKHIDHSDNADSDLEPIFKLISEKYKDLLPVGVGNMANDGTSFMDPLPSDLHQEEYLPPKIETVGSDYTGTKSANVEPVIEMITYGSQGQGSDLHPEKVLDKIYPEPKVHGHGGTPVLPHVPSPEDYTNGISNGVIGDAINPITNVDSLSDKGYDGYPEPIPEEPIVHDIDGTPYVPINTKDYAGSDESGAVDVPVVSMHDVPSGHEKVYLHPREENSRTDQYVEPSDIQYNGDAEPDQEMIKRKSEYGSLLSKFTNKKLNLQDKQARKVKPTRKYGRKNRRRMTKYRSIKGRINRIREQRKKKLLLRKKKAEKRRKRLRLARKKKAELRKKKRLLRKKKAQEKRKRLALARRKKAGRRRNARKNSQESKERRRKGSRRKNLRRKKASRRRKGKSSRERKARVSKKNINIKSQERSEEGVNVPKDILGILTAKHTRKDSGY